MERANASVVPTARLSGVAGGVLVPHRRQGAPALGRCRTTRSRCSTRWPGCTRAARTASARATRLIGTFRAHGLLVPVWDLAPGTEAEAAEAPAAAFETRLRAALEESGELSEPERRARAGLTNRQVTLR